MADVRLWMRAWMIAAEALVTPPGHSDRPDRAPLRVMAGLRPTG